MTPKDLIGYQRLRIGPDGAPLKPDGVLGPKTQWALDLDTLPLWRSAIVLAALKWVGLKETAPNRGPEIDAWLRACNVDPEDNKDDPWCAAFASMAIRAGGFECREASVHQLARLYPETETPLPGDLCVLRRPNGTGHVDIVTGVSLGIVSVVGGNVGNQVRAGARSRAGRTFHQVGEGGIPQVVPSLPMLGAQDR